MDWSSGRELGQTDREALERGGISLDEHPPDAAEVGGVELYLGTFDQVADRRAPQQAQKEQAHPITIQAPDLSDTVTLAIRDTLEVRRLECRRVSPAASHELMLAKFFDGPAIVFGQDVLTLTRYD